MSANDAMHQRITNFVFDLDIVNNGAMIDSYRMKLVKRPESRRLTR